jgi:hypothetical protein
MGGDLRVYEGFVDITEEYLASPEPLPIEPAVCVVPYSDSMDE